VHGDAQHSVLERAQYSINWRTLTTNIEALIRHAFRTQRSTLQWRH